MKTYSHILLCLLLGFVSPVQAQEKTMKTRPLTNRRAAVLFANQNYTVDQYDLQKSGNDVEAMKAALEQIGFTVIVFEKDLNQVSLERQIRGLATKLKGYHTVFFYYSGHGGLYNSENYIIPTDVPVMTENADVKTYGVSLNGVYEALREASVPVGIVVSDACRNLVIAKGNAITGMVLPTEAPTGTFTMFATRSGKIARENTKGQYGYFTQELLKHLATPSLTLEDIFKRTRDGLKAATAHFTEPQIAGYVDELGSDYVLVPGRTPTDASSVQLGPVIPIQPGVSEAPSTEAIAVVGLTNGVLGGLELAQETASVLEKAYPGYTFVAYEKGTQPRSTLICEVSEWTEIDLENRIDSKIHKYKTRVLLTVRQNGVALSTETLNWGGIDYAKEAAKTNSVNSTIGLTRKLIFRKR